MDLPTVHQVIASVKHDVGAVGKNKTMGQGAKAYKFRSIDDIYNSAHGPMAEHGLVIVPHRILDHQRRDVTSKNDTPGHEVVLTIKYRAYGPAGDHVSFVVVGEATDWSDKASNKAHTAADKIALVQLLKLPYSSEDPDESAPEQQSQPTPEVASVASVKERLIELFNGDMEKAKETWKDYPGEVWGPTKSQLTYKQAADNWLSVVRLTAAMARLDGAEAYQGPAEPPRNRLPGHYGQEDVRSVMAPEQERPKSLYQRMLALDDLHRDSLADAIRAAGVGFESDNLETLMAVFPEDGPQAEWLAEQVQAMEEDHRDQFSGEPY